MSDLLEPPEPGNAPEFSVSEISFAVKRVIEGEFGHVRIRGELGRVTRPRSGHVYLDLKDDNACISGVIWRSAAARLTTEPEEGLEVIATGRLTTYPGQSKYQIVIEHLAPAGKGALMAQLEKRRAALAAEGLFDAARKRPLPFLPEVIGVVTSPTGAVIRDILHRLGDRFPRKVLIWPVAVQGAACPGQVAAAIRGFNALAPGGPVPRPDLLIVARGGGSIEDLWGFNEEVVVRAAAQSAIPLISAVGHETDTTLIDHAADYRAPTPTAAAERAVPVRLDLLAWVDGQGARLSRSVTSGLTQRGQRLRDLARALPRRDTLLEGPRQRLDAAGGRLDAALDRGVQARRLLLSEAAASLRPGLLRQALAAHRRQLDGLDGRLCPALRRQVQARANDLAQRAARLLADRLAGQVALRRRPLEDWSGRLESAFARAVRLRRDRLDALERLRTSLGYEETLRRGFAVVRAEGHVVTARAAAARAAALEIQFADGRLAVRPDGAPEGGAPAGRAEGGAQPPDGAERRARPARPERPDEARGAGRPPRQGSLF